MIANVSRELVYCLRYSLLSLLDKEDRFDGGEDVAERAHGRLARILCISSRCFFEVGQGGLAAGQHLVERRLHLSESLGIDFWKRLSVECERSAHDLGRGDTLLPGETLKAEFFARTEQNDHMCGGVLFRGCRHEETVTHAHVHVLQEVVFCQILRRRKVWKRRWQ